MSFTQQQFRVHHQEEIVATTPTPNPHSNSHAQSALQPFQPSGALSGVFEDHQATQNNLRVQLSQTQLSSVEAFQQHYTQNSARYEAVAAQTNIPAPLIAALHWRESTGDFTRYLHQGDPLGRPAVNEPRNIPVFHDWEKAAVHALQMKNAIRTDIGIDAETRNLAALATYSEAYNGLGYHLYKGMESPYIYAGTNAYSEGKYVADGTFSSSHVDQQPGVAPLLGSINGVDAPTDLSARLITEEDKWLTIIDGHDLLRNGSSGAAVKYLQQRLNALGYTNTPDGRFGPQTQTMVTDFQNANNLPPDGVVGKGTAGAIEAAYKANAGIE